MQFVSVATFAQDLVMNKSGQHSLGNEDRPPEAEHPSCSAGVWPLRKCHIRSRRKAWL